MEDSASWTWSFYSISPFRFHFFPFLSHFPFSGSTLNLITPYSPNLVLLSQFFWPALEVIMINSEVSFFSNTRSSGLQFVIALTVLLIQIELIFYISFIICSIEIHLPHRRSKKENITQQILRYYRYIISIYFSPINIYVPTILNRVLLICLICK